MGSNADQENPYAAPQALTAPFEPNAGAPTYSEVELLRAFVGRRAERFLRKWEPRLEGSGPSRFNWPAFFLTGLWFSYRKMYRITMIFYAILLLEGILEEILFVVLLGMEEAPMAIHSGISLIAAVTGGKCGNGWYLNHARRVIAEVRGSGLEGEALLQELRRRGGTNVGAAIGMFLAIVVISIAVYGVLAFLIIGV
jgi:hypothetical protein